MPDSVTPWTVTQQASLSITNSWSLSIFMSIELVMPSNHPNLCHPLLLQSSIFPSIRVFSNESVLRISWPSHIIGVSTSISVLPMHTQGWSPLGWTCWISLQSKGLSRVFSNTTVQKASVLWCSAFLIHSYMTTAKNISLTRQNFVDKVMSLLFIMLSRLVITFLPRRKCLLISWLWWPSAVVWSPRK